MRSFSREETKMKAKYLLGSFLLLVTAPLHAEVHAQAHAQAQEQSITLIAVPLKATSKTTASSLKRQSSAIQRKLQEMGEAQSLPVFPASEASSLTKLGDPSLAQALKIRFKSESATALFKAWAKTHAPLFRIEANPKMRLTDVSGESSLRALQWGLKNSGGSYTVEIDDFTTKQLAASAGEDSGIEGAPAATRQVIVAVLDSGVEVTHPALQSAILTHPDECAALKSYQSCVIKQGQNNKEKCDNLLVDHDGNGYPLDCNGWNLAAENDGQDEGLGTPGQLPKTAGILGNGNVADYIGHGTHVAGIIAAQLGAGAIEGIAPQAKILPVRVISGEPSEKIRAQEVSGNLPSSQEASVGGSYGLGDIVARGILYALRSKAQIINMSLGWPDPMDSELIRRMITLARAQGAVLVAAAGNDSTDHVIYPCRYDGVVCVGAYAPDGSLAFFSNFGSTVDVLAPGWNILSTYPTGLLPLHFTDQIGYDSKDGTSMAAPFVSGILARLIGTGMSADEAYSRLIIGARPTRASQIENPALFAHPSLSGNADLGASLRIAPQALVVPSRKDSLRIEWDRNARVVPMTFYLQNHWVDAKNVKVTIAPESEPTLRLSKKTWALPSWNPLEEKAFALQLMLPDAQVNSELDFRVRVTASNAVAREFVIRAEIVSPVGPETPASADHRTLTLVDAQGAPAKRSYQEIRTVLGDTATREYLGVRNDPSGKILELLVEDSADQSTSQLSVIQIRGTLTLPKSQNQLKSIYKIRDLKTGAPTYVLFEGLPSPKGALQMGSTQLTWLDASLKPRADRPSQTVDIATTYMTEDFQWQLRQGELIPTWYSLGKAPASERKAFDPWNPGASDKTDFRIYILASDGIHTLELPKEYSILVSLLPQSPAQKAAGAVSVLLAQGSDYALQYATAELIGGAWTHINPVTLPTYHNLRGIVASPVLSLNRDAGFAGAAFPGFVESDVGPKGSRRTSVINPAGAADFTAYPLRNFDAITDVTATYLGDHARAQFTLTKYQIQFHDFNQQSTVMMSQKRFSFLPAIFAIKSFFPVIAQDTQGERLPALFVPGDFVFSKATQVILPRYNASGKLEALTRPAKFHLESKPGCTALATARAADTNGSSELVFFCGDRFLTFPLNY
jgi:hypothetical protein